MNSALSFSSRSRVLHMCRNIAAFVLLLILWGNCSIADAGSGVVWLIEPGQSFGAISIGDDFSEVRKIVGDPDKKKEVQNGLLMKYDKAGIVVQVNGATNKVQFIGATVASSSSRIYKTKDGLAVGKTRASVEKIYGPPPSIIQSKSKDIYPDSQEVALYVSRGIAFHYDAGNKVVVILVFDPSILSH